VSGFPVGQQELFDIDGDRINVRQDGVSGGVPVVLIHAFAGSIEQWDDVTEALANDHHVVRIDLLGHGGSDKPERGYSMPEQATRVAKVMTLLGITHFFAIGQSGGGNVVVALLDDPTHAMRVKGAIVIGTPPDMSFVNLPALANIYAVPMLGRLMWRITSRKMVSDTMASLFAPDFGAVPSIVVDDFQRMTRRSYVQAKGALEGYAHARPLSTRVSNSAVPLHVVFGEQDQWIPPACTTQWQRVTHATVALMPGVGHTPPLEAPGEVAAIIRKFTAAINSA
jgi:pimeloyl-ACP methyl ester carboxylesterase